MSTIDMTRADRVAAALDDKAALIVTDLVDIRWLTGFTGSNAIALVGAAGERLVLTDFRYLSQVESQVDPGWERQIRQDLLAAVADVLPTGRSGFDEHDLSFHQHGQLLAAVAEDVELVPAGSIVKDLRAVKDEDELVKLRAVAKVADEAFEEVVSAGLVGRTERDVALDLEIAMRRRGADGVSFPPIIAAGMHGALPHAEPRDVPIPPDTLVVIDWGAQMDGYASDCTRTVATGPLDPRDRAIYDTVLEAQEAALAAVVPGPTGKEVDAVARAIIDEAGHAEHFGHGLGHGVGLEVHEGPRLSKQGEVALTAGHVVTVEPGIYVPGAVGVRIEDLVAVTADGHEVLSSLPKALRTVT